MTMAPSSNAFGPFKLVSRHVAKSPPSTIVRKFIGSSYLDSMSNDDKATQNDVTAALGNEAAVVRNLGGIKPSNAADGQAFRDSVNGFTNRRNSSTHHVNVSDSFEKTIFASYSDWARKHGKETSEMRYAVYKRHYLLQIEHTKQTGQYFELNKFADLTEEEFVAARDEEAKLAESAKSVESGQAPAMGGSSVEAVANGVPITESANNRVQERPPSRPTYSLSNFGRDLQEPFIDDAGMEAYLESMEQAVAEIEALNRSPELFNTQPEDEVEPTIPAASAPMEEPPVLEMTAVQPPEASAAPIEEPVVEETTEENSEKVLVASSVSSYSSPNFILTTTENANNDAVSSPMSTKKTSLASMILWIRMKALKSWKMTRRVSVFSYRLASLLLVWSLHQTLRVLRVEVENA